MFHLSTLKTKTFWTGLASVGAGAYLCYTGQVTTGAPMIATGAAAITGRDAVTKLILAVAQAKG
jgi:hypothetical protein